MLCKCPSMGQVRSWREAPCCLQLALTHTVWPAPGDTSGCAQGWQGQTLHLLLKLFHLTGLPLHCTERPPCPVRTPNGHSDNSWYCAVVLVGKGSSSPPIKAPLKLPRPLLNHVPSATSASARCPETEEKPMIQQQGSPAESARGPCGRQQSAWIQYKY